MAYYKDIREYLEALDRNGKLRRVRRLINKDTELVPVVRLQFRGLPEEQRTAFVFDNITDVKGKRYAGSVAMGVLGGSEQIYAMGMMCKPEEILEKRAQAERNPIQPKLVEYGPVHEEVHMGDNLLEHGGLDGGGVGIAARGNGFGEKAGQLIEIHGLPDGLRRRGGKGIFEMHASPARRCCLDRSRRRSGKRKP